MAAKVLVAPLNWGLGHATRCIPMIRYLVERGEEVHIASDGNALQFLCKYFPELKSHQLPKLEITYTRRLPLPLKFPEIAFRLFSHYFKDRRKIKKLQKEEGFDIIFSDNRYGIRAKNARNYLITHQMRVIFSMRESIAEKISSIIIKRLSAKFNACLIPDYDSKNNLCGKLSLPHKGMKYFYTNPQSRFPIDIADIPIPKFDLLIILSGPEPQRSKLERIVTMLSVHSKKQIMLVRGTHVPATHANLSNLRTIDFAGDTMLQSLVKNSSLIITRAGYSTIMDLNALGRGAILIPTPHQPEQEYLARWLDGKRGFKRAEQSIDSLKLYF